MPLRLTSWFRRRLVPLVALVFGVVATAAPLAFFLLKRHELLGAARVDAARVGAVVEQAIQERPGLWAYDAAKLRERLQWEGLASLTAVEIRDRHGGRVPVDLAPRPFPDEEPLLWVQHPVKAGGALQATVWVGQGQRALFAGTLTLAAVFTLLGAALGGALYLLPMRALGSAEKRIRGLVAQLELTLKEEERRRIARDLHDGVGQALTAARLQLLALAARLPEPGAIDPIAQHLDEALDEVRRSLSALAPPALAELGLEGALERHCQVFGSAVGMDIAYRPAAALPSLPPHLEVSCLRLVQEALHNTARHAGATRAEVQLSARGQELLLAVQDNGHGFSVEVPGMRGLGFLRERVHLLGGTVHLPPAAGGRVEIRIPLPEQSA